MNKVWGTSLLPQEVLIIFNKTDLEQYLFQIWKRIELLSLMDHSSALPLLTDQVQNTFKRLHFGIKFYKSLH